MAREPQETARAQVIGQGAAGHKTGQPVLHTHLASGTKTAATQPIRSIGDQLHAKDFVSIIPTTQPQRRHLTQFKKFRPKPAQPTESQPWGWSHSVQMLMHGPVGGGDPSSSGTKPQKRLNQHLDTAAPHSRCCSHCTSPRGGSDPLRSLLPALRAGHSPSMPLPAGAAQRTGLRSYGGGTTPGSATRG